MITGFLMIILLLVFLYFKTNTQGKIKLNYILIILALAGLATWSYTSFQTGGLD